MAVVEGKKSFLPHLLFMEAGGWEQAGGSTSLRPGPSHLPVLHRAACSRGEEKWEEKGFCG